MHVYVFGITCAARSTYCGLLVRLAVTVSVVSRVGGVCFKCSRILSGAPMVYTRAMCIHIVKHIYTRTYLWFAACVIVCALARLLLGPVHGQVTMLGMTCWFCGGGFSLV